jgi:hypothetical protein
MAKIKLDTKGLTLPEKVTRGQRIITALTNNPDVPGATALLAQFTSANTTLNTGYNDAQAARAEAIRLTDLQGVAEEDWDRTLSVLASFVEAATLGDADKIRGAGFDVRVVPGAVGLLPAPGNLVATMGDLTGTMDLMWDRVRGANSYVVQLCPDPLSEANWRQIGLPTKSSFTVASLTSGSRYWFRVAAVGAAGQGPWSDQAMKMAP